MVYLYKKIVGGKPYYYLRASKRAGNAVVSKDIAYLGNSIKEVEEKLEHLPQKEIRKAYKTLQRVIKANYYLEKVQRQKIKSTPYFSMQLHEQIEAARLHYDEHFLKLHPTTQQEVYQQFLIDFAYNSTSIEGNTITLEEAQKLLQEDLLPKDKTLREVYDLQNTQKVFFWLLEERPMFNEELVIAVHDRLLDRIDVRKGYRTQDIRIFKSHFDASPVKYVRTDVKLLFAWLEKNKDIHPLALAVMFHHKLEKIHPFFDGNGRTGRMLMNYLLLRHHYPPFVVTKKRRGPYLDALQHADKVDLQSSDVKAYAPLLEFVVAEFLASYWNNFNT